MYAHFETPNGELGIDDDRKPIPSLVVRSNSKRRIQAWGQPGGWKVESDDELVAEPKLLSSLGNAADIEIKSYDEGTAELHAFHGRMSARLFVRVVDPHEVRVNFHFFTSGPSQSTMTRSHAVQLLEKVNKIYEPQSYIKFRIHRMDAIQDAGLLALDFATENQPRDAERNIWDTLADYVKKHYPMQRQRNVFCVKKWGANDGRRCNKDGCHNTKVLGQVDKIGGHTVILQTSVSPKSLPQILAHELGHTLGLRHDKAHANNLMAPTASVDHLRITERQVHRVVNRL